MADTMTAAEFRQYLKKDYKVERNKKPTTKPRKAALKKADREFSLLMRAIEADEQGIVKCVTCNQRMPWYGTSKAHWGHWQSRGYNSVRFDPKNGGVQCLKCNTYKEGEKEKMKAYLIRRYGETEIMIIEAKAKLGSKVSNFDLEQMAEKFSEERKNVCEQKKLKI